MLLLVLVQMQVFLVPADNHCSLAILTLSVQLICIKWKKLVQTKKSLNILLLRLICLGTICLLSLAEKSMMKED